MSAEGRVEDYPDVEIRCYLCHQPIDSGERCEFQPKKMRYRHEWDCLNLNHRIVEVTEVPCQK